MVYGEVHGLPHTAVGGGRAWKSCMTCWMQQCNGAGLAACYTAGQGLSEISEDGLSCWVCLVQAPTRDTCSSRALPGDIVQQQGPQQLKSACLLQSFHILHGRRKRH